MVSTCNDQADAAKTESLTEEAASCYRGITTLDATGCGPVVDLEFKVAVATIGGLCARIMHYMYSTNCDR